MRLLLIQYCIATLLLAFYPSDGFSAEAEPPQDAALCDQHFAHYEQAFKIPANLLRAVSLVESGLAFKSAKIRTPWPWTINAQGKGYFFKTKAEAVAAVRALQRSGQSSIDVGCMQINLHYHPDAFNSPEEAFDPQKNIAYAARFLQSNFSRYNNWKSAVAAYHSETTTLGHPYAEKVLATWRKAPTYSLLSYANLRTEQPDNTVSTSSLSRKRTNISYLSPRMRERRKSNIMITVHQPSSRDTNPSDEKVTIVENITQNALHNFNKNNQAKAVTLID